MIQVGDTVFWKWGNGFAEAEVVSIEAQKTTIESKGKLITRNGTAENPALILVNAKGVHILKFASEVQKAN